MPLNIIGMIGVAPPGQAAVHVIGGGIDPQFLSSFAQAHEASGYDAVLVGYSSSSAEGFQVAQYCAHHTERLKFLVAHRPGFVAPTLAARTAATFDNLTGGRLWLHIITGGVDADQRRDGDWLGHDERYARTDEYLDVLRRMWTSDKPFDHEGAYYRFERRILGSALYTTTTRAAVVRWRVRCRNRRRRAPLRRVRAVRRTARRNCGEYRAYSCAWLRSMAARHASTCRSGRSSPQPKSAAWKKAELILASVTKGAPKRTVEPEAETARRLVRLAAGGDVHDERLWTPIAGASAGSGNTTALVGTPEQVADALVRYYQLGVGGVLLRGFDPFADTEDYGRELIPLIREKVAAIDAAGAVDRAHAARA